jgi:Lar family restriction alleviation protein
MQELKPCPFCASRDLSVDTLGTQDRPFYAVSCGDCEATGPLARSYEGSVEAWNKRSDTRPGDGQ